MKTKELRELSIVELQNRVRELKREIFNLRLQRVTGQLEKPSLLRDIRREIARASTLLTQRNRTVAATATSK